MDKHPGQKIYVQDVRFEAEQLKKTKAETKKNKKGDEKKSSNQNAPPEVISYLPYRCGLCDHASETIEKIRQHCGSFHEINSQFKCSLCDVASDNKAETEGHCQAVHGTTSIMMRIFYVDPTSTSNMDTSTAGKITRIAQCAEMDFLASFQFSQTCIVHSVLNQ